MALPTRKSLGLPFLQLFDGGEEFLRLPILWIQTKRFVEFRSRLGETALPGQSDAQIKAAISIIRPQTNDFFKLQLRLSEFLFQRQLSPEQIVRFPHRRLDSDCLAQTPHRRIALIAALQDFEFQHVYPAIVGVALLCQRAVLQTRFPIPSPRREPAEFQVNVGEFWPQF